MSLIRFFCVMLVWLGFHSIAGAQEPVYKNLVFEGGGIRGIAYAGALTELEQRNLLSSITQTGGTSVGAVAALLVALGYNATEIRTIMEELKVQQFNDGRFIFFGGFYRFFHNYGWYRGERFERWLGKMIMAKTKNRTTTFRDLHQLQRVNASYRDLSVTGTNLSAQRTEIFSFKTSPDMPLKTAVRISMSIPLYFSAVLLDSNFNVIKKPKTGQRYAVMIDGGITANYPISMFDTNGYNPATLGLKLERPEQIEGFKSGTDISSYQIQGMGSYVGALYNYIIESLNRNDSLSNEQGRTIYISTQHVKPRIRSMNRKEKELLYNSGIDAVKLFFRK